MKNPNAESICVLSFDNFELFELWLEHHRAATSKDVVNVIDSIRVTLLVKPLHHVYRSLKVEKAECLNSRADVSPKVDSFFS
jgi:hypothetical protein